jgi:hypothetical protein
MKPLEEMREFGWVVPANGYRWITAREHETPSEDGEPTPDLILVPAGPAKGDAHESPGKVPDPHPALFHLFAEVEPDADGILKFANRYGNLEERPADVPSPPPHNTGPVTLRLWRAKISSMRRFIGLWELIRREDAAALAEYYSWKKAAGKVRSPFFDSHPKVTGGSPAPLGFIPIKEEIKLEETEGAEMARVSPDDLVLLAQRHLQMDLNAYLLSAGAAIKPSLKCDIRRHRLYRASSYVNLETALWTEFASAVSEDRTFGKCKVCGKWFEVAPHLARTNRQYCSGGCRIKAHRERQDRARRLFNVGKSFEEIAEEVDSDVSKVKKWITGVKE